MHVLFAAEPACFRFIYLLVGIDLEIFSTVILCLPLIQEGQLSFSGDKMSTGAG